ncbi:ice-structuring glycoprotein [Hippocampus comes]|uniref:ice-structuring glycoprotein n=1 Tax=Hippocampus comes TaxID=109280 RepID=UPI00094E97F1|nr:PREDICTED: ice-structuring glycoprotein-like [Hippocampus comes]
MASTTLRMSAGRIGVARPRVLFLGLLVLLAMSRGAAGATWSSPVSWTAAGTSAPPAAASPSSGAPVSDATRGPSTAAAGGTSAAGSVAAPNTGSISPASAAAATPASGATWSPSSGSGVPSTVMTMSSAAVSTATGAMASASWKPASGSATATPTAAASAVMSTSAGSTSGPSSSAAALLASTAASPKSVSTASVATPPVTGTTRSPNAGSGHPAMTRMTSTPGGRFASAASATTTMMMMTTTPPMDVIYCPVLSCNSSLQCDATYASHNATPCAAGQWCQLWKMASAHYAANCSASCGGGCARATDARCAVACCNATGCLADAFASLAATTSAAPAPSAAASVTAAMTATPTRRATTANGRKCHRGTCTGTTCYTGFRNTLQTCSAAQPHCQLIKQTVQSATRWTAGCAADCSGQPPCRDAAIPPCHLECCVAVASASCLRLNGTLNHVAARAAGAAPSPLALCLLVLLALGLLM